MSPDTLLAALQELLDKNPSPKTKDDVEALRKRVQALRAARQARKESQLSGSVRIALYDDLHELLSIYRDGILPVYLEIEQRKLKALLERHA